MAWLVAGDNDITKTPALNIIAKSKCASTVDIVGNNKTSAAYKR